MEREEIRAMWHVPYAKYGKHDIDHSVHPDQFSVCQIQVDFTYLYTNKLSVNKKYNDHAVFFQPAPRNNGDFVVSLYETWKKNLA